MLSRRPWVLSARIFHERGFLDYRRLTNESKVSKCVGKMRLDSFMKYLG